MILIQREKVVIAENYAFHLAFARWIGFSEDDA